MGPLRDVLKAKLIIDDFVTILDDRITRKIEIKSSLYTERIILKHCLKRVRQGRYVSQNKRSR